MDIVDNLLSFIRPWKPMEILFYPFIHGSSPREAVPPFDTSWWLLWWLKHGLIHSLGKLIVLTHDWKDRTTEVVRYALYFHRVMTCHDGISSREKTRTPPPPPYAPHTPNPPAGQAPMMSLWPHPYHIISCVCVCVRLLLEKDIAVGVPAGYLDIPPLQQNISFIYNITIFLRVKDLAASGCGAGEIWLTKKTGLGPPASRLYIEIWVPSFWKRLARWLHGQILAVVT